MSKLKVDQFVDLVKRSGLVDNERLNEALSGVDESVNDSGIIASILTKAGLLTEWHSEKLLQGRHKGFYLGKWKLLSHIGTGGMGSVYLAEHQVMRHRVAIKLLPNHLAAHPSYLERFHQEARASAKLNHPNMVKAHDVDHEGNVHFLVMDYVDGADLQAIVSRNGPLAYRVAAEYMRQASDGLAYAHRSGLIHRDIKPANLLVDKTNTVKILDMGLARFSDETQSSLTMAYDQKMIGTVDYLAPEQALDSHKVDERVDIYSLGCTLYFLLTGDPPFSQGTIPQRLIQHQSAEPPDIRKVRPDAPAGLIAICRKMMAKSANDRYQSADQVSQILTEWLASGDDGCSGSAAAPSAPSGASLNEDLTLAPLDDEPASRRGARQPGESSTSGVASKSGPIKEPSGVKPNQPSGIKNAGLSSAKNGASQPVKKGESSSIHGPDLTAAKGPQKPKSGVRTPVPTLPNLDKPHDLMDELLSAPALPPVEQLKSGPLPTVRRHEEQHPMMSSIAIVVGMGLLGTAIIVGVVMLLIKYAGL